MLTAADIISIDYTPDLEEAGTAFACRSLALSFHKLKKSPFDDLRQAAADTAVELAARRYLYQKKAAYAVKGNQPFSSPNHYDLWVGKHTCRLKNYLIDGRVQLERLKEDPAFLLQFPALVPLEEFVEEGRRAEDLILFTFAMAETAADPSASRKIIKAGKPTCLLHPLADDWTKPRTWQPLRNLAMKSEGGESLQVELGGLDGERKFVTERLELPPQELIHVKGDFYSLAYARAMSFPEERVGIQSTTRTRASVIAPAAWENIRVYGKKILLAGWLSQDEFRKKASLLNESIRSAQIQRTEEKLLQVLLTELNPLKELIEETRSEE
jgi:hypothetical protein